MRTDWNRLNSPGFFRFLSPLQKFSAVWITLIFLSPGFGIHVHHKTNQDKDSGRILIHSYFFTEHEETHEPVQSPPESLADHLTSFGLSTDAEGWDLDPILFGFITLYLTLTLVFFIAIAKWQGVYSYAPIKGQIHSIRKYFSFKFYLSIRLPKLVSYLNLRFFRSGSLNFLPLPPPKA
jgi:hypothetical protein